MVQCREGVLIINFTKENSSVIENKSPQFTLSYSSLVLPELSNWYLMGQFSLGVISQFGLDKAHLPCPKDYGFREETEKDWEEHKQDQVWCMKEVNNLGKKIPILLAYIIIHWNKCLLVQGYV